MLRDIGLNRGELHRTFYAEMAPANTNPRTDDTRNVA